MKKLVYQITKDIETELDVVEQIAKEVLDYAILKGYLKIGEGFEGRHHAVSNIAAAYIEERL